MNGVCVRWRGWLDVERLDGVGCLEFDDERATREDALLRDQIERYNQRLREFEDKQRGYRAQAQAAQQERVAAAQHEHQELEVGRLGMGATAARQHAYMKLF